MITSKNPVSVSVPCEGSASLYVDACSKTEAGVLIMKEVWRDVPEFEGRYKISNKGRVKSLKFNGGKKAKILKLAMGATGYLLVSLHNFGQTPHRIHRMVAKNFIPNPERKYEVNHKDGIKTNNIVSNLEWATKSENMLHSYRVLGNKGVWTGKFGKDHTRSKQVHQYSPDGTYIKTWESSTVAGRSLGFSQGNISTCCTGGAKTSYGFIWKFKKD